MPASVCQQVALTCHTEVSQLDVALAIHQYIACLDVPVDVAMAVDVGQRTQHLQQRHNEVRPWPARTAVYQHIKLPVCVESGSGPKL